ncbi:unannotated protein [freshwater metagenome]|uniref:Unannotated protein n=1 Tax=freshwater metagenome TaxID=449393 RepID=A0A6J6ZFQ7_9ZZZZ
MAAWVIARSISIIASAICAMVGGCKSKWRSLIRTQPILTLFANSTFSLPKTNSVDPPPISTTKNGPSLWDNSLVAPINESAASCSPGITSTSTPRIFLTPLVNNSRLLASRVALVAQNLIFSTPLLAINCANFSTAESVLAIASG